MNKIYIIITEYRFDGNTSVEIYPEAYLNKSDAYKKLYQLVKTEKEESWVSDCDSDDLNEDYSYDQDDISGYSVSGNYDDYTEIYVKELIYETN